MVVVAACRPLDAATLVSPENGGQVGQLINEGRYHQAEDALAPGTPFSEATSAVVQVLSAAKRMGFD